MFKRVLVPLDGSPAAEHALPWAVAAASPTASLHLIHVHVAPVPMMVEGVVISDPSLDQSIREQEGDYMTRLAERVREAAADRTVEVWNIDSEDPLAEALGKAAAEASADLVVMTTHGRGPFARFWLGSVSDEFLRHTPVPTLVYRPKEDQAVELSTPPTLKHLIIPLDGSELADKIVEPAMNLGTQFGADYTLVFVLNSQDDPSTLTRLHEQEDPQSISNSSLADRAERYLDRVAQTIRDRGGKTVTRLIRGGTPGEVVLGLAGADLTTGIALATHGRSGISRLLMGSVADEVVRHAPGPVLVFHPQL